MLLSSWHTGTTTPAFGPQYQLGLLQQDAPIIPWMIIPEKFDPAYYRDLIREASIRHLPICFVGSQFERKLSEKPYFERTTNNPNCQKLDGTYERRVSPFGDLVDWYEVGRAITNTDGFKTLQGWYRDPPYVLFVSNNEHPKMRWTDAHNYKDYVDRFGETSTNTTREIIQARYRILYRSLLAGLAEPLEWHVKCIGYNSFTPQFLGRYTAWDKYSYHTVDNMNPWMDSWDGASCNYYTDANGSTDCNLWSTQVEFMNLVEEIETQKAAGKHFELSVWNGGPAQIKKYTDAGQTYDEDRFEGWVKYGVWLTRPDTLRAFYPHTSLLSDNESYFKRLVDITNKTNEPFLKSWWNEGELVKYGPHPYVYGNTGWTAHKYMELPEYKHPRDLSQLIDVFYLVYRFGNSYLVYGHSPLGRTVKTINVDGANKELLFTPKGNFYFFRNLDVNWESV